MKHYNIDTKKIEKASYALLGILMSGAILAGCSSVSGNQSEFHKPEVSEVSNTNVKKNLTKYRVKSSDMERIITKGFGLNTDKTNSDDYHEPSMYNNDRYDFHTKNGHRIDDIYNRNNISDLDNVMFVYHGNIHPYSDLQEQGSDSDVTTSDSDNSTSDTSTSGGDLDMQNPVQQYEEHEADGYLHYNVKSYLTPHTLTLYRQDFIRGHVTKNNLNKGQYYLGRNSHGKSTPHIKKITYHLYAVGTGRKKINHHLKKLVFIPKVITYLNGHVKHINSHNTNKYSKYILVLRDQASHK